MSTVPFDTYRFIRRLTDAGMSEKQAEEIVIGAKEAAEQLVNKSDLKFTELRLYVGVALITYAPELFKWLKP